ncbi:hypothetical protein [Nitratifractor sp.]
MKRLLLICLLTAAVSVQWLSAATRAEVNVLEATENIRFLSQRITKNYLYLYANPLKQEVRQRIMKDLDAMVASIRTISMTTSDEATKDILEFLTYSKDQIEELLRERPTKETAALMLDYSETLLEGANSIAHEHSYVFNESEKMLMRSKNIGYLMERSAKYYLALGIGLGTEINKKQMNDAIGDLTKTIDVIEAYDYPGELQEPKRRLRNFWGVTRSLFARDNELFVSNLMVLSSDEMEKIARNFVLYHRKNQ